MFDRNMTYNTQEIIKNHIDKNNKNELVALDATMGNGLDLEFLGRLPQVKVIWGFDIQEEAIKNSKERVADTNKEIYFIKDSHHKVEEYIKAPIDIAMFNLGYLPQGDKRIVTNTTTTLTAIDKVINQLAVGGILTIMTYPGHEEGAIEHKEIEKFLTKFSQKKLRILQLGMVNIKKPCPHIFIINK